jgi:hypothetical protein
MQGDANEKLAMGNIRILDDLPHQLVGNTKALPTDKYV